MGCSLVGFDMMLCVDGWMGRKRVGNEERKVWCEQSGDENYKN